MPYKKMFTTFTAKRYIKNDEWDIQFFNLNEYRIQFYIFPRIKYTAANYPNNQFVWLYKKVTILWLIWEKSFVYHNRITN